MTDNLKLWNSVEKTNPKYTKEVSFGRKFTAIDPYYQIKNATEQFGMYGNSWGLKDINYDFSLMDERGNTVALVSATFHYPDGDFPLTSSAKTIIGKSPKYDEDVFKKLETNLITKALSRLGFNSDIFLGKFEDNQYVHDLQDEMYRKENAIRPKTLKIINNLMIATDTKEDQFMNFLRVQLHIETEFIADLIEPEGQRAIEVLNTKYERIQK